MIKSHLFSFSGQLSSVYNPGVLQGFGARGSLAGILFEQTPNKVFGFFANSRPSPGVELPLTVDDFPQDCVVSVRLSLLGKEGWIPGKNCVGYHAQGPHISFSGTSVGEKGRFFFLHKIHFHLIIQCLLYLN